MAKKAAKQRNLSIQEFKKQYGSIKTIKDMFNGCNSGLVRSHGHPVITKGGNIRFILSRNLFSGTKFSVVEFNPRMSSDINVEVIATKLTHAGAMQQLAKA